MADAVDWGAAGPLVLAAVAIMGSPGPATVSLVAVGSAYGVRRSAGYAAGVIAGTTLVLVAVASGLTAALLAAPGVAPAVTALAAAYIAWLAYRIATAPPLSERAAGARPPSLAGGLLLGVANPKAWVAIAATFGSARLAGPPPLDAAAKVVVLTGVIVATQAAWLAAGASIAPLLRDPRRARALNRALAVALVAATALALAG